MAPSADSRPATDAPTSRRDHRLTSVGAREQLEDVDVVETDDREVAAIKSRYATLAETLRHGQYRGVDKPEPEIRVSDQQFAEPDVVLGPEVLDDERAAADVLQEAREGVRRDEMVELDEYGRGNEADAVPRTEQLGAARVVLIVSVEQRDQRSGVDYERNGGGS